jgi:hypothetical protein
LPESYLLLFFSLTFFLHPCGVQPFEILREIAVNIYRVLRVDSPTHYRFDIRIFRSVKPNVNKPAPCSTICHLACKCRIAGSCHQDARSVQLPGRLIAQRNKVQIFRVDLLEPGVAKKTDRERKLKGTRSATAERAAGAASRELRITCVAFGIRNHPCGWIAERHGAYRPALPAFGAVEEPEDLPFYRLPFCRGRETPRHLAR